MYHYHRRARCIKRRLCILSLVGLVRHVVARASTRREMLVWYVINHSLRLALVHLYADLRTIQQRRRTT